MFDEFKKITSFDLEDFFQRFQDFITNKSQNIIDYYSGLIDEVNRDYYGEYESLLNESNQVLNLFDLNQERFQTVDFWQLMDYSDDIRIKLETIGNFSKFARSSVAKESFTTDVVVKEVTRYTETIEEMMARLGSTDRDEDWVEVALKNSLVQEDYTPDGGKVLDVIYRNNTRFFIESIVDNPTDEKIKGLDVDRNITFEDDDLKILSYNDTLSQTIDILSDLKKNDNPEFPEYGVNPSLIIGSNLNTIALPAIIRQVFQTFSTDDVIRGIGISNTKIEGDSIYIDVNISIKSGEEQKRVLNI